MGAVDCVTFAGQVIDGGWVSVTVTVKLQVSAELAAALQRLDLIARDGDVLVFVEVKSRATDAVAAPDRAIDQEKLHRMRRAASSYLQRSKHDPAMVRCDLVSIVFDAAIRVTHVRDAFRLW